MVYLKTKKLLGIYVFTSETIGRRNAYRSSRIGKPPQIPRAARISLDGHR